MSQKEKLELWSVSFSRPADSQRNKLKRSGNKPSICDIINLLVIEITKEGPYRINWPNYGPLSVGFHCHLKKGKPTYVACWRIVDKINRK